MNSCFKWMAVCVVLALALSYVPQAFGVSLAGVSVLIPLLMIGCCVLPMLALSSSGKKGGCCAKEGKDDSSAALAAQSDQKSTSGKTSCH